MAESGLVQLSPPRPTLRKSWIAPLAALAAFAGMGYLVFLAFARGFFAEASATLLGVALAAGVAAFFSPCAFPFLPTVLSVHALRAGGGEASRAGALGDGFVAGLGVVTFNTILGVAVGMAGLGFAQSLVLLSPSPSPITVAIRLAVAGLLIMIGSLQLLNRGGHGHLAARIADAFARLARDRHGRRGLFVYGFAYTAIGIGCTGPFLASVVLVGFAAGGPGPAVLAFLVFAFTMAGLMISISVLAAWRPMRTRALVERASKVKPVAGGALVVFGALLALLTAFPSILRPLFP